MPLFLLRPRIALSAMVLALPFAASGACAGRTACFAYTQGEYAQNDNTCPAQSDALAGFTDPHCPGPIVSVDGAGSFDGELCCYPVTYDDIVPDCNNGTGAGGSSGFPPPGSGPFPGEAVSSSSSGVMPTCIPACADALMIGGPPCPGSGFDAYTALQMCAGCAAGVACNNVCPGLCGNGPIEASCQVCIQMICLNELDDCNSN